MPETARRRRTQPARVLWTPDGRRALDDAEFDRLARDGWLARCAGTVRLFSIGNVNVTARYADCSRFECPACGRDHDDRRLRSGGPDDREGYSLARPARAVVWGGYGV